MNGSAVFVGAFALSAVALCGVAILRIIRAEHLTRKPLWLIASLVGFVGFGVDPGTPGDLLFHIGVQVPPIQGRWSSVEGLWLKAMFPIGALIVLMKLEGGPEV